MNACSWDKGRTARIKGRLRRGRKDKRWKDKWTVTETVTESWFRRKEGGHPVTEKCRELGHASAIR